MKILATTQGSSLRLVLALSAALQEKEKHELSLIISNSSEYKAALKQPDLAATLYKCKILKEWDIFERSKLHHCSIKETGYWEKETGEPLAWTALADRKLNFGKRGTFVQSYIPYFHDNRTNQIIAYAYKAIDQFFYEEKPDVVLSIGCQTYCDYISAKIAAKQGIPSYILSTTEAGNNICLQTSLSEWPEAVWDRFGQTSHLLEAGSMKMESIERATEYVQNIRDNGVICDKAPEPERPTFRLNFKDLVKTFGKAVVLELKRKQDPDMRADHNLDSYLLTFAYKKFIRPWRTFRTQSWLQKKYIDPDNLEGGHRRIYFPLYSEPDTAIQICGRPYINQIELARILSHSTPADCEILVQDAGGMSGYRSLSYYRKLLSIPKIRLVQPNLSQSHAIALCNAAIVIAGTAGLKAAIQGKPVLVMGKAPYARLGRPYFFQNTGPWKLHQVITDMLDPEITETIRREGEEKFIRLLSVLQEESCQFDHNPLSEEGNRKSTANRFDEHMDRRKQFEALVEYVAERLMPPSEKEMEEKVA